MKTSNDPWVLELGFQAMIPMRTTVVMMMKMMMGQCAHMQSRGKHLDEDVLYKHPRKENSHEQRMPSQTDFDNTSEVECCVLCA